jgi:hypothetical protein
LKFRRNEIRWRLCFTSSCGFVLHHNDNQRREFCKARSNCRLDRLIGAGRHERSADRLNYCNGYRDCSLDPGSDHSA